MDVISYILAKRYADEVASNSQGKSAYEIAQQNGFKGTEEEWLESLSPYIGENGHWFIGDRDLKVVATPDLSSYYSKLDLLALTTQEVLNICK